MWTSVAETGQDSRTSKLDVVGICEYKICRDPAKVLAAFSLGSCVAVFAHDRSLKIGAMIHYALPEHKAEPDRARKNPAMFGDTGLSAMFKELYALGAKKDDLDVYVVGGASMLGNDGQASIGKRNALLARKLFWKSDISVKAEAVGGHTSRTVFACIADGKVTVKHPDGREDLQ